MVGVTFTGSILYWGVNILVFFWALIYDNPLPLTISTPGSMYDTNFLHVSVKTYI